MIKDFKYILKRIIIGVGIFLVLSFLRGNLLIGANAKEITPVWDPFATSSVVVIDNRDTQATFNFNRGSWANWGFGYLRFNFSVSKVSGSSTSPVVAITNVAVNNYTCEIGTTSMGNSTFNANTYSAVCPMNMGSNGLDSATIFFSANQQNELSQYRIQMGLLWTFEKVDDFNVDFSSTNNTINNQTNSINQNQNQNTQSIINNQNSNTQSIINNQNQNTQQEIESQKVCNLIDKSSIKTDNKYIGINGVIGNSSNYGITDYINIYNSKITTKLGATDGVGSCYYDETQTLISCIDNRNLVINQDLTIPNNARYIRFTIRKSTNSPQFTICKNGNQAMSDDINNVNNTLNDDNVSSDTGQSFFDDFQANSHGLSGIITAPLRLINSLSSSSCSSLSIPLPFVNQSVSLPCMSTIYSTHFSTFLSLYQLITTGVIGYWVLIKIFGHVKGMQSPNDDRIEVFDL